MTKLKAKSDATAESAPVDDKAGAASAPTGAEQSDSEDRPEATDDYSDIGEDDGAVGPVGTSDIAQSATSQEPETQENGGLSPASLQEKINADLPAEYQGRVLVDEDVFANMLRDSVDAIVKDMLPELALAEFSRIASEAKLSGPSDEEILAGLAEQLKAAGYSIGGDAAAATVDANSAERVAQAKAADAAEKARKKARERENAAAIEAEQKARASAQADFDAAKLVLTTDFVGKARPGPTQVRLADDDTFIAGWPPLLVTSRDFSIESGRLVLQKPVDVPADWAPAIITSAWLIGDGAAVRCSLGGRINAGGGANVKLPAGHLIF